MSEAERPEADQPGGAPRYVKVDDLREEGDDSTCLRPLGLCDLGGCCDICWYRHDHPRFKDRKKPAKSE